MRERILKLMKDLVSLKSRTGTEDENQASDYIYNFICNLEYFQKHPENCGLLPIVGDPLNRHVPYGLLRGNSGDTVILSGHFDVVDESDYGHASELAFCPGEKLEKALIQNDMTLDQRTDMESGQWIWGKGVADMKGGLAVEMSLLEQFSAEALKGSLEGSILFIPVPDEESYSCGMRSACEIISQLKKENDLDYKLLINPEPTDLTDEKQVMYLGTAGKIMPVVLVQGISAHIGHCFDGYNPLDIITGIYKKTNGSLVFTDKYADEAVMPPSWLKLRDLKDVYDVSIPMRAGGYFNLLSLNSGPDIIIKKLKAISSDVCSEETLRYEKLYGEYKEINRFETKKNLGFSPKVFTYHELTSELLRNHKEHFATFYQQAYEEIKEQIAKGTLNYPDGTMKLMEKTLDFAAFTVPVVLIAFAPPYYPAVNSNEIKGKEGFAFKAFEDICRLSKEYEGREVIYRHFFAGISDNSYAAVSGDCQKSQTDAGAFAGATPLWGELYNINFKAIADINVPAIIYGPVSKEYHKWSERVEKNSLLETVPKVMRQLIRRAWNYQA